MEDLRAKLLETDIPGVVKRDTKQSRGLSARQFYFCKKVHRGPHPLSKRTKAGVQLAKSHSVGDSSTSQRDRIG